MKKVIRLAPRWVSMRARTATTGILYLTGGSAGALTTTSTDMPQDSSTAALLALALLAVLLGAGLLLWGRHCQAWLLHAVVAFGSVLLGGAILLDVNDLAAMGVAVLLPLGAIITLHSFDAWAIRIHTAVQLVIAALTLGLRDIHPAVIAPLILVHLAVVITMDRLIARTSGSMTDALTGLPNRRGLDEHLDRVTALVQRNKSFLSLALLDVDHFKGVNDQHGHATGDALLQGLAQAWTAHLPEGVLLSRHGGDEFALLATGVSAEQLQVLCERLSELAGRVPAKVSASVSVGIAEQGPGESCASLVRRADAALYAAKAAGRACIRIARPDDDALSADLAIAIATDAVSVVYQPIVRPETSAVIGVEALARWHHPELGSISPATFIPLAERNGQVAALGRLVLGRACREALHLRDVLGRDLLLTVNASGHQLSEPGFVDDVAVVLLTTGWPATQLVIEVTESTVEIASATALSTLAQLRELGVAVAIDDFGTGYSAFSHLDTLPADYLKLDAAFTADITTSPRRAAMLETLLALSRRLELTVIAEGVENAEHAALLTLLGCPLAQGYHYARPSSAATLVFPGQISGVLRGTGGPHDVQAARDNRTPPPLPAEDDHGVGVVDDR